MKFNKINNKKIVEKIINILLNVLIAIFSVILLVATYTAVQVKLLGQDYSNFFGYSMFEVQTNSMENVISAGDWILVKLNSKIELKDIITYKLDNEYITHRVVEIHDKTYVTRGDANNTNDKATVDQNQIIGKVEKIIGGFGILRKTILNPFVLIILIISLFLIESIIKDRRNIENKNKFYIYFYKIIDLLKENLIKLYKYLNKYIFNISFVKNKFKKNIIPENKEEQLSDDKLIVENNISNSDIIEVKINKEEELEEKNDLDNLNSNLEKEDDSLNREEYPDDLEKTQFFRIIPVDTNEYDETMLEIAKYEIQNQGKELKENKKVEVKIEPEEEKDDDITKINLNLLKENSRKNKNIIDALMNIKIDELNELVQLIIDDAKLQTNEPTIRNIYITIYIHARYYNYFSEKDLNYKGKNFIIKADKLFKEVGKEMIDNYDGNDNKYSEKVDKFINIFNIIASLEQAKDSISEIKTKKEFYKNEIIKYQTELDEDSISIITEDILSLQKTYDEISKYFFKKLESNTFYLNIESIKKDLYIVNLEHNIAFNKIYSNFIIDKTYEEGIIAEDTVPVKITLLLAELLKDMINGDFNKKYFIMLPDTIYNKKKKILRFLKMFDDEYAKSHITIFIDFETLIANKKIIKKLRKYGYKFAVGFKNINNLPPKEKSSLYMSNGFFVNKEDVLCKTLEKYIPNDLSDYIIYYNIYDKFYSLEGE
ncbi:MAG: signal peptidase I [Bacilli bacterium]|nr:signal peptidase I [Bacilli bacterium]